MPVLPQESELFSSQPYAYYVTVLRISRIQVFKIKRHIIRGQNVIEVFSTRPFMIVTTKKLIHKDAEELWHV
ncbi:hypothetical protein HM131_13300 [Halobacillus mangrovi]|uniref:Uncharacterized protein n=1 Tax=Halobacillus mangrovi TaxID=402384 RepID=A0A1W5ZWT8_9BACI|nr:hypothetical protein HM131_13300 [Halobacillus mangrovi]